MSALCRELGIRPVTLYRYVGPQGQLREQGQAVNFVARNTLGVRGHRSDQDAARDLMQNLGGQPVTPAALAPFRRQAGPRLPRRRGR